MLIEDLMTGNRGLEELDGDEGAHPLLNAFAQEQEDGEHTYNVMSTITPSLITPSSISRSLPTALSSPLPRTQAKRKSGASAKTSSKKRKPWPRGWRST